jgi:S1-C subfamily serine protease
VGFAVPINSARRSLQQLIANGSVSYAFVGVVTSDLTPALARHFGYGVHRGAVLTKIEPHSPAAAAHLQAQPHLGSYLGVDFPKHSDVIVAIAGRPVRARNVVRIVTDRLSPGQRVRFTIIRDGKRLEVPVVLSSRSSKP